MSTWSNWRDIEEWHEDANADEQGVYQIRLVTSQGEVIPIPRLRGIDKEGKYYIGRSGHSDSKTNRSFGARLKEFLYGGHSGGNLYSMVEDRLREAQHLKNHKLQYRVTILSDEYIEQTEALLIRFYLEKFGELPPGNRSLSKKYKSLLED